MTKLNRMKPFLTGSGGIRFRPILIEFNGVTML